MRAPVDQTSVNDRTWLMHQRGKVSHRRDDSERKKVSLKGLNRQSDKVSQNRGLNSQRQKVSHN